ncbi:hypothetical protein ASPVEDRAFT_133921 [Aspergillus versicolor CBS 583.65]|uniref:GH16 domain-containing protein n=1 Tax=Aspergillus versicolor CBS 583.65 TaxID=1036611 RepID=A0A1L9PNQ5_ASPVE|nr:uncharacterized protein ASPVEDRAFT_133921 [Aspergillus versicolor CBS 583.65]OJJ03149.1 hypothetical protein ASPVEDRAFT_133921 [Aspergillus versicolor CBS 583.65]
MTKLSLSLLASLSFIVSVASTALPPSNTANSLLTPRVPSHFPCDCYLISGEDPGYFTNYKFWDFRNVRLPHNHSASETNTNSPLANTILWESETLPLSESPFNTDWQTQSWSRNKTVDSIIPIVNSEFNAFFARHPNYLDTTQLVLRTTRLANYSSTAEIESVNGNFFHCSIRVRMRLIGACAGIFTYRSAMCESDLEFLTSDPPNTIHYANQPDYDPEADIIVPGASEVVTTVPRPWSAWGTHRMDWFVNKTRWYADGELQADVSVSVPDRPSILAMNLWSDGGVWTGDMKVDESVYMGIEWIEIAYNTSTVGLSPIETNQRHRNRPSEWRKGGSHQKKQVSGGEARESCERPCYLDKMQYY